MRRVLAWYLDFLLFGAPWALVVWGTSNAFPDLQRFSLPLKVLLFLALEVLLLRLMSWSPGHWLLGIHRYPIDRFATPDAAEKLSASYVVEPWLKENERWWTIAFGVLAILDGVKAMVRWTMWTPAIPFMGHQLDDASSAATLVGLGVLECAVGCLALRLRPLLLVPGAIFYGGSLISTIASWELWPTWIERYVTARRAFQGIPVREGEVEVTQLVVPPAMIAAGVVMGLWMLLVAWWARGRRAV